MNTFFVGCFCCRCWQSCQGCQCWKGQWVAKCFEYSFGHCFACMHNTRTIRISVYVCVAFEHRLCVRADSSSVSCGFSTESLRKSYIWPVMAVIKTKRFWFLPNNNTYKSNLLYTCIYRFNICITQQFHTLIAILWIVPASVAKLLKAPYLPLKSCNKTYFEWAELQWRERERERVRGLQLLIPTHAWFMQWRTSYSCECFYFGFNVL